MSSEKAMQVQACTSIAIQNMYRCEICTRTYKFDRSWHKTPPKKCGRCTRLEGEQ